MVNRLYIHKLKYYTFAWEWRVVKREWGGSEWDVSPIASIKAGGNVPFTTPSLPFHFFWLQTCETCINELMGLGFCAKLRIMRLSRRHFLFKKQQNQVHLIGQFYFLDKTISQSAHVFKLYFLQPFYLAIFIPLPERTVIKTWQK